MNGNSLGYSTQPPQVGYKVEGLAGYLHVRASSSPNPPPSQPLDLTSCSKPCVPPSASRNAHSANSSRAPSTLGTRTKKLSSTAVTRGAASSSWARTTTPGTAMATTLGGPPRCFICNQRKLRYKSNHDGYVTITCKNCGHSWIEEDD